VPRHHLVPQFLLRHFADADERLVMVHRAPPHRAIESTVKTACAERDFYKVEAEDLEDKARDGHDPEVVEGLLSVIEENASAVIDQMISGNMTLTKKQRLDLALFTALQVTRGWRFRDKMNEIATLTMQKEIESLPLETWRAWLRHKGEPHGDKDVEAFRASALGESAPRLVMSQPHAVGRALQFAVEDHVPQLLIRTWRLLQFDRDLLVTSDSPVGMWTMTPDGQYFGVGVANARIVCLPLNRRTALAMIPPAGPDRIAPSGLPRAQQINTAVMLGARKWIYHHPDDSPFTDLVLPPNTTAQVEVMAVHEQDGERRELLRIVDRPTE
jgi:Protein of unknown function (DUF4238)